MLGKSHLMDKRGAGVQMILSRSEALSGRRLVYDDLDGMELKLTVFAAPAPEGRDALDG